MAVSDHAGPGTQAVIGGVTDLLPVLRQRAQEAEDARVVPAESVKALEETGFFRLLQPASAGGLEADPVTFFTAVRLIASACGPPSRNLAVRPRQCQPRANLAGGASASMVRTCCIPQD